MSYRSSTANLAPAGRLPAPYLRFRLPSGDVLPPPVDFAWMRSPAGEASSPAPTETMEQFFLAVLEHTSESVAILDG